MATRLSGLDAGAHGFDNAPPRGQNTEHRLGAGIDDDLVIDEHLELPVAPVDHVDVFSELSAEPSRHPGGVKSGDSIGAVADGDPCQGYLLAWGPCVENAPRARKRALLRRLTLLRTLERGEG